MTEGKHLSKEDFSNVWKDNENTLPSGLKLDLVEHLSRQRLIPGFGEAKEKVIKLMNLDQYDNSQEIKILEIGCGLGVDLLLVAEEAIRLNKSVSIVGLDQNSTMIEESIKLYDAHKELLPSNVSIQIVQGDILHMEFNDGIFDIVRSDITLQHVELSKALTEIRRVLKLNGRLIALEGGAGDVYSSDEVMIRTYDKVVPSRRDGGAAIQLQFFLPKLNFNIKSCHPKAFLRTGHCLEEQDKDWVKLRGMCEIMVTKEILTEDDSKEFQRRYIEACRQNQIVIASMMFIIEAIKTE